MADLLPASPKTGIIPSLIPNALEEFSTAAHHLVQDGTDNDGLLFPVGDQVVLNVTSHDATETPCAGVIETHAAPSTQDVQLGGDGHL